MEKINWKVEGMTCSNCALSVHNYLEKQGLRQVKVNPISGDVSFENEDSNLGNIKKGIKTLGYSVAGEATTGSDKSKRFLGTHLQRFWFCLPFALLLMLHMVGINIPVLHQAWLQFLLCLPVFIVGMNYFGRSAWKSLRHGVPNMNVLVALGATAAFGYSLYGWFSGGGMEFLYFETAATIFTLIFLGNYLEDASVNSTQRALKELAKSQKVMANMIAFDDQHQEQIFPLENTQLREGDLVLIKTGEQVPIDCKILWGEAQVNEALLTGESTPVYKTKKDQLIGGSVLAEGTVRAQVTATGDNTVLSGIIRMVQEAQGEKPPMQQLADRISAIFVPAVIAIAVLTFIINYIILGEVTPSLMRSIAVLVISCPCAMGLATPAAIAVGLGRGARKGILYRNASSLELFKDIRQLVFDKTGTLTTGKFVVKDFLIVKGASNVNGESSDVNGELSIVNSGSKTAANTFETEIAANQGPIQASENPIPDSGLTAHDFKNILYSLEKYSTHPIAKSIAEEWKTKNPIRWQSVEEQKGLGIRGTDKEGNVYMAGSYKTAAHLTDDDRHNIYLSRNNELLGWVDIADELRPESKDVVNYLRKKNIHTVLLTGDRYNKAKALADILGIDEVLAEQTPEQKLAFIKERSSHTPTAMVGDGINDAPALAQATVGISMADASQLAVQSASVVLTNQGLQNLPEALGLGKHTFLTIKQNLFWAFSYNIVAIPVAAVGLLGEYGPTYGALIMALSDVVLAVNSVRLFVKKVK